MSNGVAYSDQDVFESLSRRGWEPDGEQDNFDAERRAFESVDERFWYPDADRSLTMPTRGAYPGSWPAGAIVHFTAGRCDRGDPDAIATVKYGATQAHCYFCISKSGRVYQTAPLNRWGSHAGQSSWQGLGSSVSSKLVGIEICNAGQVKKTERGFEPWWNRPGDPKNSYYTEAEVRHASIRDNILAAGTYHRYTPEQEASVIKLLLWLHAQQPSIFKLDFVLGHDEVSPRRKDDPGGSFSMTMPSFRAHLKGLAAQSMMVASAAPPSARFESTDAARASGAGDTAATDFEVVQRIAARAAATAEETYEARGLRDYEVDEAWEARRDAFESTGPSDDEIRALISDQALLAVVGFEVTSEKEYHQRYERPIAPAGDSGITVGIGYDLGYNTAEGLRRDFEGLIPSGDIETLVKACGLRGDAARRRLNEFRHVCVPWNAAIEVFRRATIPRFGRMVLGSFPNAADVKGHAFGALFSLVYNRGNKLDGERRKEMRQIRDACAQRSFAPIPGLFRAMKHLWQGKPGLAGVVSRREAEAILFERGLQQMQIAAAAPAGSRSFESVNRDDAYLEGDGYRFQELPEDGAAFERANPEWDKVKWPSDDNKAPDYRHVSDRSLTGTIFEFGSDELELLLQANSFQPSRTNGRIPFALRGAELVSAPANPSVVTQQEGREKLLLRDARPDHRSFRCVIGVYDCDRRRISGYSASTVPNPKAVASHVADPPQANMMLTGCYPLVVGWHQWSQPEKRIPGCLVENGHQKAVLRTNRDHILEITDDIDNSRPCGDNNHPGKSEGPFPFSSWGCLVVKGSVNPVRGGNREQVTHTGEWALYRKALGLPDRGTGGHGKVFDFVLLTGLEGAIAHTIVKATRAPGVIGDQRSLQRLRQGSHGELVKRLQQRLNLSDTGIFDHATAKALAQKQMSSFSWCDGVYSPKLDNDWGFGVFAPTVVAGLESRARAQRNEDELEGLFFEMGLENEMNRRGAFEGARSPDAAITTTLEFGPAALKSVGRTIAREMELQVHSYICGQPVVAGLMDQQAVKDQVNSAAKFGSGVLKECLVTVIAATTSWFVSRDTIGKFVDVLLVEIVQPAVGKSVMAGVTALDGGVAQLCQLWQVSITERYSGRPTASAQPQPAAQPDSQPKIDALLDLIDQSAFGAKLDAEGVRNYLKQLRTIVDEPGQQITDEQASRLIKALCDSSFTEQVQGATGHDPYLIVSDIEASLQPPKPDFAKARSLAKDLHGILGDARIALLPDAIARILKSLKSKRMFDELSWLADRFLTRNPALVGVVAPIYAQGLIDGGRITAAIRLLENALQSPELTPEQLTEVKGLLGRAHKQVYANHVRSPSEAIALKQSFAPHLTAAIENYASGYDPQKPADNTWHGINAIALIRCAERDRVSLVDAPDVAALSSGMIATLEPGAESAENPWTLATIAEAWLANGDEAKAAKYYGLYARHPKVDAFQLAGTARQLEEVWRIKAGSEGAGAILTNLKSALAVIEGGSLQLSAQERRDIGAAKTLEFADEFERPTKDGRFINFYTLKRIVECGAAVAAIQKPMGQTGETFGTGFLIAPEFFNLDPSKSYLLTNAHVLSCSKLDGFDPSTALTPETARIVFENDEIDGKRDVYKVASVKWQSPSNMLDATLIELDRVVPNVKPLRCAAATVPLVSEAKDRKGTRLTVIGHPKGGRLSLSLQGSLDEISAVLVDKGGRGALKDPEFLHYSTPTEGGNSGSPVFEVENWSVVGLHHAGFPDDGWPCLGGRAGTNKANEGIWMESIRRAASTNLKEAARSAKKRWFAGSS